jgi:hypothetical protein
MNEVDRLRRARTLFERAQRDNVTMTEARRRIHAERYQAVAGRLHRGVAIGLCGTAAPDRTGPSSAATLQWWQRD